MLSSLKKFTILYVEDELEIQANTTEYLESYFAKVYVASDGQEGLSLYEKYHPDVLLFDINIPKIDGLSLAKKIRTEDEFVKILMLTAHTEQEKLLFAIELKLTRYLIKPVSPKAFKEALKLLSDELSTLPNSLKLGLDYIWDRKSEQLVNEGKEVLLSDKEHRLLTLLISKKNEVVLYVDIILAVWDDAYEREISINSVKNQVRYLRKKVPVLSIYSVYGKGYTLR